MVRCVLGVAGCCWGTVLHCEVYVGMRQVGISYVLNGQEVSGTARALSLTMSLSSLLRKLCV